MKVCSKVCNECPFTNASLPGWLGPATVEEVLDAQQYDYPFICHLHRVQGTTDKDILDGKVPICRGFILSANKSFKLFGQSANPLSKGLAKLQEAVNGNADQMGKILNRTEFKKHHEKYNKDFLKPLIK